MPKRLLVTYNAMDGIPTGRHEVGNVIVYSGDYGRQKYAGVPGIPPEQAREAEAKVAELRQDIAVDVDNIDEAWVYVGQAAMGGAVELIRDLQRMGKKIHMIACDCDKTAKENLAASLRIIKIIWCECGGRFTCAELVHDLAT